MAFTSTRIFGSRTGEAKTDFPFFSHLQREARDFCECGHRKNTEVRHSRGPSSLPQLPMHTPANSVEKYPGLSFKGEHYSRLQSESGKKEHGDWTGGIF